MRRRTAHRSFRRSLLCPGRPPLALHAGFALRACVALAASLALAACEADAGPRAAETEAAPALAEPLAPATSEGPAAPPEEDADGAGVARVCRDLMLRERDCSAVFIPALVAERVRLDLPAGIAARAVSLGQEALVSEALDEFADDSQDDRIESTCRALARELPAERGQRLAASGQACLALDGCAPFVACAVPLSIQP